MPCRIITLLGATMITNSQIVPMLLEACPEFRSRWEEHRAWWENEPAGDYNDASEFARFLIDSYDAREFGILQRAFAVIEKLIQDGDAEVQNIGVVGYLESLQTQASWKDYGSEVFADYLLPRSRAAWYQIHQWWAEGKSLLDIVREENGEQAGAANRSQPIDPEPNGTSGAAGSGG